MKHAKDLKQVLKFAVTMCQLTVNPFDGFTCTNKKVKRTFITADELNRIIELAFAAKRLEEVRDCSVFSCFTGYAFIDARALTPNNVTYGIDGNKWIIHDRSKTDNPENLPLLPVALEIVEKYKTHPYCIVHNKLLPINSNQRYNEYLKEIADLAGRFSRATKSIPLLTCVRTSPPTCPQARSTLCTAHASAAECARCSILYLSTRIAEITVNNYSFHVKQIGCGDIQSFLYIS